MIYEARGKQWTVTTRACSLRSLSPAARRVQSGTSSNVRGCGTGLCRYSRDALGFTAPVIKPASLERPLYGSFGPSATSGSTAGGFISGSRSGYGGYVSPTNESANARLVAGHSSVSPHANSTPRHAIANVPLNHAAVHSSLTLPAVNADALRTLFVLSQRYLTKIRASVYVLNAHLATSLTRTKTASVFASAIVDVQGDRTSIAQSASVLEVVQISTVNTTATRWTAVKNTETRSAG